MTLMKVFLRLHNWKIDTHKMYMYQFMRTVQHQEMDCIVGDEQFWTKEFDGYHRLRKNFYSERFRIHTALVACL